MTTKKKKLTKAEWVDEFLSRFNPLTRYETSKFKNADGTPKSEYANGFIFGVEFAKRGAGVTFQEMLKYYE